jgi:hypothetical protein
MKPEARPESEDLTLFREKLAKLMEEKALEYKSLADVAYNHDNEVACRAYASTFAFARQMVLSLTLDKTSRNIS